MMRTKAALCAYVRGPDGYPLVDCAVGSLRVPNGTTLPCVCVDELKHFVDRKDR